MNRLPNLREMNILNVQIDGSPATEVIRFTFIRTIWKHPEPNQSIQTKPICRRQQKNKSTPVINVGKTSQ